MQLNIKLNILNFKLKKKENFFLNNSKKPNFIKDS